MLLCILLVIEKWHQILKQTNKEQPTINNKNMPQNTSGGIQRDCKYEKENKKLHKVDLLYTAGLAKCLILWLNFLLITTFFNHSGKKKYFKQEVLFRGTGKLHDSISSLFRSFSEELLGFHLHKLSFFLSYSQVRLRREAKETALYLSLH